MKTRQWYCGVAGQEYGPFHWDQMRALAAAGRIIGETYVRRDIDEYWYPASLIPGLLLTAAERDLADYTAAPDAPCSQLLPPVIATAQGLASTRKSRRLTITAMVAGIVLVAGAAALALLVATREGVKSGADADRK